MVPLNGAAIDFSRLRMHCVVVFLEGLHRHVISFGKRKDAEKRPSEVLINAIKASGKSPIMSAGQ